MKCVDYRLVNENLNYGISKEKPWRKLLSKKYPSIKDNNSKNKFSSMDSISNDNGEIIEHEHKSRKRLRYNQYCGPMVNACKIHKGIDKIKNGIRQIFYWTLEDDNNDMYYWELTDLELQKDEIVLAIEKSPKRTKLS